MNNYRNGRIIGRLSLNLEPNNRLQTRNINELTVINPIPAVVPEDILDQQRRRNNPGAGNRQIDPPPIVS